MSVPSGFLGQVFMRKQFAFAGNTLLIYDYLLTLSSEVTHIWNTPWTFVKAFFLINRYGNLIGQTFMMLEETGYLNHNSHKFCLAFELYYSIFAVFSGESIRLLVLVRTCAILGCQRRIAMLWSALYVAYAVAIVAASAYILGRAQSPPFQYLSEIGTCYAAVPAHSWMVWLMSLLLDGLMLLIVCRGLHQVIRLSPGRPPSRLIRLLARDAFIFYFAALFNALLSLICWTVFDKDPRDFIAALVTYPILSVVGQRLVLNLRKLRAQQDSTRDFSREINRQLAVLRADWSDPESDLSFELGQLGSEQTAE